MFLWIGGLIMALGCALALDPGAQARRARDRRSTRRRGRRRRRRRSDPAPLAEAQHLMKRADPLDRARGRRRRGRCSGSCSRSRQQAGFEPSVPRLVLEHAAGPDLHAAGPRRQADHVDAAEGQDVRRQLLQQLVHPVPAGSARAEGVLRRAQGGGRLRDGRHHHRRRRRRRCAATCARRTSRGRSASIRNGAASLSFGTTGQPETYVIAPDGVAVCGNLGASTQAELDTWLQAARDGQECTCRLT